jgi:hypothetical protein
MPYPWKPHPKAFIRRGTGTGGVHYNKVLTNKDEMTQNTDLNAFPGYGIAANNMASSFDHQTRVTLKKQNRLNNMNRYRGQTQRN